MKTVDLLEGLEFDEKHAHAQPLHVDREGRALRFTLRPGQSIKPHSAPHSPIHLVVLKGTGLFSGQDNREHKCAANTMVIFDPGEIHTVQALEEELVFVSIYKEAPHPSESPHRRMLLDEET